MEQITVNRLTLHGVIHFTHDDALQPKRPCVASHWHSGTSTSYSGQWDYEDAKGQLLWEKYG